MPFTTNGKRDYKREANWEKSKKPQRLKDRVMRIQARRLIEKQVGNLPSTQHIDHITPLTDGGSNSRTNLRVRTGTSNLHAEALRKKRVSR